MARGSGTSRALTEDKIGKLIRGDAEALAEQGKIGGNVPAQQPAPSPLPTPAAAPAAQPNPAATPTAQNPAATPATTPTGGATPTTPAEEKEEEKKEPEKRYVLPNTMGSGFRFGGGGGGYINEGAGPGEAGPPSIEQLQEKLKKNIAKRRGPGGPAGPTAPPAKK